MWIDICHWITGYRDKTARRQLKLMSSGCRGITGSLFLWSDCVRCIHKRLHLLSQSPRDTLLSYRNVQATKKIHDKAIDRGRLRNQTCIERAFLFAFIKQMFAQYDMSGPSHSLLTTRPCTWSVLCSCECLAINDCKITVENLVCWYDLV